MYFLVRGSNQAKGHVVIQEHSVIQNSHAVADEASQKLGRDKNATSTINDAAPQATGESTPVKWIG
jgi:hypothetical protein